MSEVLKIRKAEENNLKSVDVDIPRKGMTVITGVSGSGKSSLAFDTIFQEGQRKYIESLSAYARQFIGSVQPPKVERIQGISPTISIDQKTVNRNARSTVGTITEILDHLRLLFARLGVPKCPECGEQIKSLAPSQMAEQLLNQYPGAKTVIMAPVVRDRKGEYRKDLENFLAMGFLRARIDGELRQLEDPIQLARYEKHTIELVMDRIKLDEKNAGRLLEAIEGALKLTKNQVSFLVNDEYLSRGTDLSCPNGHGSIPELEPRLFSFNDKNGQCGVCKGLGKEYRLDPEKILPDPSLSVRQGAIKAMTPEGFIIFSEYGMQELEIIAKHYKIDLKKPWKELNKTEQELLMYGSTEELEFSLKKRWSARRKRVAEKRRIRGFMEVLQRIWDRYSPSIMHRYMDVQICPSCKGARLNPFALAVDFGGYSIHDFCVESLEKLSETFAQYPRSDREKRIGEELFKEIQARLEYLKDVGLGYLTLERTAASLSGGESQRIRLASQVGAGLQGVTYVLDEPSIGLHPRDNEKLLSILKRLKELGNTVVVVEHDEDTMREADQIIDIGPSAGIRGGELLAQGTVRDLLKNKKSLTGQYLNGIKQIEIPERRAIPQERLAIFGAAENNLKGVDVSFPVGVMTAVTGVSGSGKSTLIYQILHKALARHFHGAEAPPGLHDRIEGLEHFEKVIDIDQTPIGRTPRSNPVTYTKVFDEIRQLFALLPESKLRGYNKGRFSFNVKGGRCEDCKGAGVVEVEMQLLANVVIPCESCNAKRFNPATLEVHYKGKTIFDILEMTIDEALEFFGSHPKITKGLSILERIGLGYLKLGQPSTTLSGGEAQRMKIASELQRPSQGKTLYLLDEPTTGLHFEDIAKLLECMQELVEKGNTMIVVEHNLDIVKSVDWVVDLGPEAGAGGGELVAEGRPEDIAKCTASHTGRFLKKALEANVFDPGKARRKSKFKDDKEVVLKGAKKHNLKNLDLTLPTGKLIGLAGVSGAGKSSLAFHTLFAEGQRRFVESLSTYARRFLGPMDRGAIESVEGLAPAIAVDQSSSNRSPRSTVATITELYDYFRLLFARIGEVHCPRSGKVLKSYTNGEVFRSLLKNHSGEMATLLAPVALQNSNHILAFSERKQLDALASKWVELGFTRLYVPQKTGGKFYQLEEELPKTWIGDAYLMVDRVKIEEKNQERIIEALENAIELGHGLVAAGFGGREEQHIEIFSAFAGCGESRFFLDQEIDPKFFSFNSHWGACEKCSGLGYVGRKDCPDCEGEKLKKPWRDVTVGGKRLGQLSRMTVDRAKEYFASLELNPTETKIAGAALREVNGRLEFLHRVGLGYLNLDRTGDTLSGGEAQRIRLASQIGSGLEGVLYVLDEPTIGLHQADTKLLLESLTSLRDLGNTVLVVEHDLEFLEQVDHLLELGPEAGERGGQVIFQGSIPQAKRSKDSLTGKYLKAGAKRLYPAPVAQEKKWMWLDECYFRNLDIDALKMPMGELTVCSGVSGSGKSTLILECLYEQLHAKVNGKRRKNIMQGEVTSQIDIKDVVVVDQSPIGSSPRSTPATYSKIFDKIRDLYATLPEAKMRGWDKGRFSYNKAEGRCPACEGRGFHFVEMHFLSDLWETCEVCHGRRFAKATLEVTYKSKSIADVMDLTFEEALPFFQSHRAIKEIVQSFVDLGLGYLRLGQPGNTLSGGEAQRMKIATELAKRTRGHCVYLLDEPTTGLHSQDIEDLWAVLCRLTEKGNTLIVIEHHADFIRNASWVVDLGPGGGEFGGKLLYSGPPAELAQEKENATGRAIFA